jgi:hypothetical protein
VPKKLAEVRLVVPDTGVLISLAHGNLLDLLMNFAGRVHLAITDVVEFESTRRADMFDAQRIRQFLTQNSDRISVEPTSFHAYLEAAKKSPSLPQIPDIGELSIYGLINGIRNDAPKLPTLVLFEDNWFVKNHAYRPTSTHLVSLAAFLKYAELVVPGFSFDEAVAKIKNTRPGINLIELDSAGLNDAEGAETVWTPTYRP